MLGLEPAGDFDPCEGSQGRRPAAPDRSLLLQKSAGTAPWWWCSVRSGIHRIVISLDRTGYAYGNADDPVVTHIKVAEERLMGREADQRSILSLITRTFQRRCQPEQLFDSNDAEMAEGSQQLGDASKLTDMSTFMARSEVTLAFSATVPLGVEVENYQSNNFVDDLVFGKLQRLGLPASGISNDASFLRRQQLTWPVACQLWRNRKHSCK